RCAGKCCQICGSAFLSSGLKHFAYHRRYQNDTGSAPRARGRGLSPPVRILTDPGTQRLLYTVVGTLGSFVRHMASNLCWSVTNTISKLINAPIRDKVERIGAFFRWFYSVEDQTE